MAEKLLLALLVLGPALVFTAPIITSIDMYVTKFDEMYNKYATKNPSAHKEEICEIIKTSIDEEGIKAIKFIEAMRHYQNKPPRVDVVMIDGLKKTTEPMKESQGIMCKIRNNENDWAALKAAVAKTVSIDKSLEQCFTDLENELAGNAHLQGEIKKWVKLINEMRAVELETTQKITKIREAEAKEMYGKLMSGKISMKDLSGTDHYNMVRQMAQEGKLKPGESATIVKQN